MLIDLLVLIEMKVIKARKSLRVLLVLIEMKGLVIETMKGLRVLLVLIEMKVIEAMKGLWC